MAISPMNLLVAAFNRIHFLITSNPCKILTAAVLYLSSIYFLVAAWNKTPSEFQCTKLFSAYSPMIHAVEYEEKIMENEFYQPSIYRGRPNPALEASWGDLWEFGYVGLSNEELTLLNKPLDKNWTRMPLELGGGAKAGFEAFHQIHCLSMIRQYTYRDIYNYSKLEPFWRQTQPLIRDHIDHCIETIRINLMCIADTTPYLITSDPDGYAGGNTVNFKLKMKCRKYDRLTAWAEKNELVHFRSEEELAMAHHGHY